jgi:hypothetical protein
MIEIFIFLSGIVALLSITIKFKRPNTLVVLFLGVFVFIEGTRWGMGVDWETYKDSFDYALERSRPGMEPGFALYVYTIRNITDNYTVYLLITSFLIIFGIMYQIFQLTHKSFISLFYLIGVVPWYAGSQRQMIATVFFILAMKAVMSRNIKKYIAMMLVAGSFHLSAIVFLPVYFLYGISHYAFIVIYFLLCLSTYFITDLINVFTYFSSLIGHNKNYGNRLLSSYQYSNIFLGVSRKIVTVFGLIIFKIVSEYKKSAILLRVKSNDTNFFMHLSLFTFLIYFVGTFFVAHVNSRLDFFVIKIALAILIGFVEINMASKFNKVLLLIFVSFLVSVNYSRLQWLDLFHPYTSIFYNTDYERNHNRSDLQIVKPLFEFN